MYYSDTLRYGICGKGIRETDAKTYSRRCLFNFGLLSFKILKTLFYP